MTYVYINARISKYNLQIGYNPRSFAFNLWNDIC